MERVKRILVLGDSQVGKTSFLETLFEKNNYFNLNDQKATPFPKKTNGCFVHVHYLNEYYPELNPVID